MVSFSVIENGNDERRWTLVCDNVTNINIGSLTIVGKTVLYFLTLPYQILYSCNLVEFQSAFPYYRIWRSQVGETLSHFVTDRLLAAIEDDITWEGS